MSTTTLTKNFTPLIDTVIKKYGIMVAAVFGRAWRHCQEDRGVCFASVENMAGDLNVSYATVQRHLKTLVDGGYLEDCTPDLRNHPHTYRDTGKAGLKIEIVAYDNPALSNCASDKVSLAQSDQPARSNCASHSRNLIDEERKEVKKENNIASSETGDSFPLEPKNKPVELLASTPGELALMAALKREAAARYGGNPRGYQKFPTLACKQKFEQTEARLDLVDLQAAIKRALEVGCTSVIRAVDYVAKWGINSSKNQPVEQMRIFK